MQVCTSLQTDNHATTPPICFFTGWMPFLPSNQQRQSTEGNTQHQYNTIKSSSADSYIKHISCALQNVSEQIKN